MLYSRQLGFLRIVFVILGLLHDDWKLSFSTRTPFLFTCGTADFPSLPLEVIIIWLWSLISLVLAVHAAKITFIIQPHAYPTDNLAGERFGEWLQMSMFFKLLKTILGAGKQLPVSEHSCQAPLNIKQITEV